MAGRLRDTRIVNEQGISQGPDYVRTPASLAYLAQTLAHQGFAVVIPDVNSKERPDWGGEPDAHVLQTALAKLHLGLLARLDKGESLGLSWAADLKDKLDLSTIVTVGHSSGGGYVVGAALAGALPHVKASVAIQPAFGVNKPVNALVPTMVIAGECDEQIPAADTQQGVLDLARANPKSVVVSATIAHATHIGTLSGGGSNRVGLVNPPTTSACRPAALLAKPTQRAELAQLTADFLTQALRGGSAYTLRAVPGTKVTAVSQTSAASVTVTPIPDAPAQVQPKSVTYTRSTLPILPPKPTSLVLNDPAKREI